jgi:paraquat-inducible protein A
VRRDWPTGTLLLAALALFAAGLTMPAFSITSLAWFTSTFSLLDGVFAFYRAQNYVLFAVVFVFSLVLPASKILVGLWAWAAGLRGHPALGGVLGWLAAVSKWSMLDVFIVALMVLALEGSLLTFSDIHAGIVLFAASVVLSTLAMMRLQRTGAR